MQKKCQTELHVPGCRAGKGGAVAAALGSGSWDTTLSRTCPTHGPELQQEVQRFTLTFGMEREAQRISPDTAA